jgi:NADH-quinone oxidoreductase subunit J
MLIAAILLAAVTLAGAVWVVTLRNLFRAALSLGLVLLGVAGLFILLEAEFIAFAQILVYVGAVLTLVIFAVMLTSRMQGSAVSPVSRQTVPAAAVSVGLFIVLTAATRPITWPATTLGAPAPVAALGQQLVTTLVLPFEVISLVFVVVAIGAIVLASPGAGRDKRG